MLLNNLIATLKNAFQNLKSGNISLAKKGNTWFIHITVILLIIPIVEVIGLQTYIIAFGNDSDLIFKLIDYGLKIIDHIYAIPVITGMLAYASRLVDSNNNGISDEDEKATQIKGFNKSS